MGAGVFYSVNNSGGVRVRRNFGGSGGHCKDIVLHISGNLSDPVDNGIVVEIYLKV